MKHHKLIARWRARDMRVPADYRPDLRDGRPDPVDSAGLPCERCGEPQQADQLALAGGRMLCPACKALIGSLAKGVQP